MDIGKGDWVLCVDASVEPPFDWHPDERIVEGATYHVSGCDFDPMAEEPVVYLTGHERHDTNAYLGRRMGYAMRRFRPLKRGPAEAVPESLKQPLPSKVEA